MSASTLPPEADPESPSDPRWLLAHRIAASPGFKNSPRLCEFLYYVVGCEIRNEPEGATERQVGINVFGRMPGYNSSEDSIVRTHARLLRQKLAAYFEDQGRAEAMVIEIPKGHYLPVFHSRLDTHPEEERPIPLKVEPVLAPAVEAGNSLHRHPSLWILGGLALVLAFSIGAAALHAWRRPTPVPPATEAFWRPFLTGTPPLVIYSNALFTGNSTQGMRYANPGVEVPPNGAGYVDTYTGVGELAAVHTLTRLFDRYDANFVLKRSLLVTWDEAKQRNLIFIGSTAENPSLRVLPPTTDFSMADGPGVSGIIVNHHPLPGEPAVFSRPEYPLTRDYSILALLPGVSPGQRVLVFSGLMTYGTQGAVDYVCQPATVSLLLSKVRGPNGEIRPFEAVLETDIGGGVPLRTHLVTVRVH